MKKKLGNSFLVLSLQLISHTHICCDENVDVKKCMYEVRQSVMCFMEMYILSIFKGNKDC